jgi:hypothetical protein
MKTFRKSVLAVVSVVIGSLTPLSPAHAGGPGAQAVTVTNTASNPVPTTAQGTTVVAGDVNVTNTPNVSVTNTPANPVPTEAVGTTTVAGNVAITGTPNVSVTNTPNVNVTNFPNFPANQTVSFGGIPQPVTQSGTWNVTVQDRDSQARNFYQAVVSNGPCTGTCVVSYPVVPTGKRLIVQQVSTLVTFSEAGAGAPADIELRGGNVFQFLPITPAPANFGSQTQYLAHAGVLAAYDSGQNPMVDVFVPSVSAYSALAAISGYMIDIP